MNQEPMQDTMMPVADIEGEVQTVTAGGKTEFTAEQIEALMGRPKVRKTSSTKASNKLAIGHFDKKRKKRKAERKARKNGRRAA